MKRKIILLFVVYLLASHQNTFSQNEFTYFSDTTRTLYNSNKYLELIDYANAELPKVISSNDSLKIAKLYFEKAKGLYHKSRHDESIDALNNAVKYLKSSENHIRLEADIMYFKYINYGLKSFILKELEYGLKSLELYESESDDQKDYNRIFILYRRLATPYVTIGDYETAKKLIDKAENLLNDLPEINNIPKPLLNQKINLGYQKVVVDLIETAFYPDNYDSISIKEITQRVVKEKQKQDSIYLANTKVINGNRIKTNPKINFHSYSSTLNFYCRYLIVNQAKIDFDLSLLHPDIDRSIELLSTDTRRYLELYKGNRVDVLEYEKKYDEALALMDTIISDAGENHNRYVNFLLQKARILFQKESYKEGKLWIKKGIEKLHTGVKPLKDDYSNFEPGYKLEDVFMLMSVGRKIYEKSNLSEEEKSLELSRIYRMAFKQFLNTYTTQPLNKRTQNVFNNIVEKLIETETLSIDDISHIENVENRLAWEKFTQSRNVVQLPVVDSLEQIEFTLRKQLMNARRNRAEKDKDSLTALLQDFKTDLEKKYPTISNFTQESFEITEFQKNIKKEEVVLKYMFFKDQFAVFEITQENINWSMKAWGSEEEKLLYDHLSALKEASSDLKSKDDMLSRILIPKSVSNYSKLTIIPDRSIYFLPFETLIFKNNYLLKSHSIRYSSHLRFTFFNENSVNKDDKTKATIFAPEYASKSTELVTRSAPVFLEGAQKEAQRLESLFPSQTFVGTKATKENFIKYKSGTQLLHLAMHASVDKDKPGLSHFMFSNEEKLFLEELYALKIPADLAVLSACNTAVGNEDSSLNINSLHRAFNYAGTKATIASLWEVPDESTSQIMISFYEYLKEGENKSSALQKAKINYLNNTKVEKLRHPYYWAGFVLYGDDAAVVDTSNIWIIYLLGIIILVIVLVVFRRKKQFNSL
jgi:CHAT domain-containing protein